MTQLSKYFVDSETETIYLEPDDENGAWVKIKSILSIADQDNLGRLLLDVKVETGNPDGIPRAERRRRAKEGENLSATFNPSTVALLQISLTDWSFLDNNNNKLPLTPEWIGKLKPEWANLIQEEIDSRNPLAEPKTLSNTETH